MLEEPEIRVRKGELLRYIEHVNKDIANRLSKNKEDKARIHECEAKIKIINEILGD